MSKFKCFKKIAIKINNNNKYNKFKKINYNNLNKKQILEQIKKRLNCTLKLDERIINDNSLFDKEFKEFLNQLDQKVKKNG